MPKGRRHDKDLLLMVCGGPWKEKINSIPRPLAMDSGKGEIVPTPLETAGKEPEGRLLRPPSQSQDRLGERATPPPLNRLLRHRPQRPSQEPRCQKEKLINQWASLLSAEAQGVEFSTLVHRVVILV